MCTHTSPVCPVEPGADSNIKSSTVIKSYQIMEFSHVIELLISIGFNWIRKNG